MAQPGFFDFEQRCDQLSSKRDPLVALDQTIDWELFRPILERVRDKDRKNNSDLPQEKWTVGFVSYTVCCS